MSAIEYEGITSVSCSIVGVRFAADSALEGEGFEPSVPPKAVSLAPVLAEPDADPVAVAPDGIEQQREVTTKEGMLDETILIMVVDKSATITVNSQVRLGSLSS